MSKLRAVKPTEVKKFPKILIYSERKVGKTYGVCGFPSPYLIDTEHGAEYPQYLELLEKNHGVHFATTDIGDIIAEAKTLLSEKHRHKTFVVDSFTIPYNDVVDKYARSVGTEFGRHKVPADREAKHLLTMVLRLPMTVIFTNHLKEKWVGGATAGTVHDSYTKLDYYFDLILEIVKRGPDRIAIVRGSRMPQLPEGTEFPWCYDELANRVGREIFEGDVVPVELATADQITKIKELLENRTDAETLTEKWWKKGEAEDWSEMTKENMDKCITFLEQGAKEAK